ncbi:hypothetical protein Abr02nite_44030 [Paractinoplanes brasiliensis]|nr:hypothetical protein Abr02nite_44030 [Actinoplanes brasiliensis]
MPGKRASLNPRMAAPFESGQVPASTAGSTPVNHLALSSIIGGKSVHQTAAGSPTLGAISSTVRLTVKNGDVTGTDPYLVVTEPTFVARFLLAPEGDASASVANVDVFVDLPDGSTWSLTIFTVAEVERLLAVWRESGEAAHGSYFWASDQLIVPEPGVRAMTTAIRELVRSGEITDVGTRSKV